MHSVGSALTGPTLKMLRLILDYGDICSSRSLVLLPLVRWAFVGRPTVNQYLSLMHSITIDLPSVIKTFDFSVFAANALTAPPYILQCFTSILFVQHSDKIRERGLHGAFGGKHNAITSISWTGQIAENV